MIILAIDPGNVQSAYVAYNTETAKLEDFGILQNPEMLEYVENINCEHFKKTVIEQVASFGMPVGETVFETVYWSGRFAQKSYDVGVGVDRIKRIKVKTTICHDSRAKDGNIRQALMDMYGGSREVAIGKKASHGPLYGVSKDVWAALAVAKTYSIQKNLEKQTF